MKFLKINIEEYPDLKNIGVKNGLLFNDLADYFALFIEEKIVGYCSIKQKNFKSAIFKTAFVFPEHRRKGYLRFMVNERLKIVKSFGIIKVEANCTKQSLNVHLSLGAKITKEYKNGITKIVYENL
jgi:GNAT superfamily N-acetyltransferase